MRWLFLLMLILNLSYIAWEVTGQDNKKNTPPPLPGGVQRIVLLSEAGEVGAGEPGESLKGGGQSEAGRGGPDQNVSGRNETGKNDVAGSREKREEVAVAEQPATVIAEDTLQVGDAASGSLAATDEQAPEPAMPEQTAALKNEDACYTLGPFRDLEKLRALTRDIKDYVVQADFRGRDETEQSLFWVYIKPLASRKQAIKTGRQLKQKKIKDFYVIRDGDQENGVSLGHFRNKKSAYRLAQKVTKLGFDVEVEPIFKTYRLYWLDYRLSGGRKIPAKITDAYLGGKINRLERACE
ncbi:MAG TPA: hypothetical protein ENJ64_01720 [Thiotrichales bacterium]|nr:hypothetical protein [Thiotrichales bacterium]